MDSFLQLVPLDVENDSDAEQGLVYGEDEATAGLDEQVQSHAPPSSLSLTASSSENAIIAEEQMHHAVLHDHTAAFESHDDTLNHNEHERRQYLACIELLDVHMQQAKRDTQQRLDAMARILALADPLEQLSEYMALKLDERQDDPAPAVDITTDLLECAKRMRSSDDSEVALLGAFVFASDPSPCFSQPRSLAAMLPVVAAVMESAAIATAMGLDHPFN